MAFLGLFGDTKIKRLQRIIDDHTASAEYKEYGLSYFMSIAFSLQVEDAGFKKQSERALIIAIILHNCERNFGPNVEPLAMSEELAKRVWPTMTKKGLQKMVDDMRSKGLRLDL